jgi:hypothetical protein
MVNNDMVVIDVAAALVAAMAFHKCRLGFQRFWHPQGLPLHAADTFS